jgi:hypothetical protein
MQQSFQVGTPKWGTALGGMTNSVMGAPAHAIRAMILGRPKVGKSTFLQTNPDAFIFNFDVSPTVTNGPAPATIWPGVSNEGQPIEFDGKPFIFHYKEVLRKIMVLKELAAKGQARPKTIVFDTITVWIKLLREYVTQNSVVLGLTKDEVKEFRHLDGRSAHDLVNNLIRNTILELHACGYGVYVVGHIANAKIALADDITSYIPELKGVSDGLWASLQGHLDLIAAFESTVQLVKEPVYSTSNPGIKTGERTVSVSKRQIVLNSPAYAGLCGKRVRTLPDAIPLEADTAWADFEKVYNNALAQQKGLV